MNKRFQRTELMLGEEAMKKLAAARVAVFGVGGVGGYLVRGVVPSGGGGGKINDPQQKKQNKNKRQINAPRENIRGV